MCKEQVSNHFLFKAMSQKLKDTVPFINRDSEKWQIDLISC